MKKIFKLNDKLFKVDGHWYLVDKEAKIENNTWYINAKNNRKYLNRGGNTYFKGLYDNCYKIIASTNKSLEGIHYFSVEEDAFLIKCQEAYNFWNSFPQYRQQGIAYGINLCMEHYETVRAKAKQYTEDDIEKAISMWEAGKHTMREAFKSLQPQIESIEVEYRTGVDEIKEKGMRVVKYKPKLNSKGELEVTINYKLN